MGLFGSDETFGRINDLIKIGEVSSINPAKCTARVVFADDDGVVSYDLPVLQRNTFKSKDYHMPDVGEDVVCIFLPSGVEEGFIVGSFYAGEVEPPEATENRRTVVFEDGTVARYDKASHKLTLTIDGTEVVFDRQDGSITVPNAVTINCTSATVNASSNVKIDTPKTDITGVLNVTGLITGKGGLAVSGGSGASVNGSLTTTGDVKAGGISLQGHTHDCPHGGSTSSAK